MVSSRLLGVALAFATATAKAQDYTVWSSFVFLQAGEHTPAALRSTPAEITSLGALQMYEAGQFLRSEYLDSQSVAKIASITSERPAQGQLDISTLDMQYTLASTEALMMGLYPRTTVGSDNNTSTTLEATDIFANGSIIQSPLLGAKYPLIRTHGLQDIGSMYIAGDASCAAFEQYAASATHGDDLALVQQASQADYTSINAILDPVFPATSQTLDNAKAILDFVEYQKAYNSTAMDLLTKDSVIMDKLRTYADVQQSALFGNLTAKHPWSRRPLSNRTGSISTIAGASLAAHISNELYAQQTDGQVSSRLNVVVGDHAPMLSTFALLGLPLRNALFSGLPLPGSAMAFELVTPAGASANLTANELPSADELMVRFRFRNGTGISAATTAPGGGGPLTAWPITGQGNVIPWIDFVTVINNISITGPGDWCNQCGSAVLFCAPWNASLTYTSNTMMPNNLEDKVALVRAGAIGAVVGIAVATLLAALIFLLMGLRFRRTEPIWKVAKRHHELRSSQTCSPTGSGLTATPQMMIKSGARALMRRGDSGASSRRSEKVNRFSADTTDPSPPTASTRLGSWNLADSPFTFLPSRHGLGISDVPPIMRQGGWGHGQGGRVLMADELDLHSPCGWPYGRGHMVRASEGTLIDRDLGLLGLDGARMGFGSVDQGSMRQVEIVAEEQIPESKRPESKAGEVQVQVDEVDETSSEGGESELGVTGGQSENRLSGQDEKVDPLGESTKRAEGSDLGVTDRCF